MLTENDYHFISPADALERFPELEEWLSFEYQDEETEYDFPDAREIVAGEWGGSDIVFYDGDTTFSENFSVQFATKKQGEDYSGYSRKIIVNGNLTAPEINLEYFTMLVVTGNVNCNQFSGSTCPAAINGNLTIKNSLLYIAEDHEDTKIPLLKVNGHTATLCIFTWYYRLPSLQFALPEKMLALRCGFEDDNKQGIAQLVHRELPLYLKEELCNKREEEWHDNIIFRYYDRSWLIKDYIEKGVPLFKDGIAVEGIGLCMKAVKAYQQKEYDTARNLLLNAVAKSPAYGYSYYWLAELFYSNSDYEQALKNYRQCLAFDPGFIWAQTDIAHSLNKAGQYNEAVEYATKAIVTGFMLDYTNSKAFRFRGESHFHLGNYADALSDLDRAISADSSLKNAWYYRGFVYFKMGNTDKAKEDYIHYLSLHPEKPEQFYND